jgi:hypothetical protein
MMPPLSGAGKSEGIDDYKYAAPDGAETGPLFLGESPAILGCFFRMT